ncbi:MAG: hypothetical protein RBR77_07515 [Thauera sp.]|jgi:hypothetical protein|nr:hypothetical protein [Thauera sp.]
MSRDGSGNYTRVPGSAYTNGTTADGAELDAEINDIATALTQSIAKDGQTVPTANLPMGGYKHTNVNTASARTEYARASQVQDGMLSYLTSVSGADTITASAPIGLSAYAAGQQFSFVSAGANTGAVTLNINAIGAKSVTKDGTTALAAGDIASGAVCVVIYDGTQFQLVATKPVFATSAQAQEGTSTSTVISPDTLNDALNGPNWATGMVAPFARSTAPSGWIKANGGTIGNAASGATTRANADTSALFSLLWSEFDNTALPIQDSSGAASTRGASAAADFAANKRLPIHDARGEFIRGLDDSRGVDSGRALGSAQLDAFQGHKHSTDAHTGATSRDGGSFSTSATSSASVGDPITDGANGTPRTAAETRPRNLAFLYCIKL